MYEIVLSLSFLVNIIMLVLVFKLICNNRATVRLTQDIYNQAVIDTVDQIEVLITNDGAYEMNPEANDYDKGSAEAFDIVLGHLKKVREEVKNDNNK